MRNAQKDAREMAKKRESMLKSGFELFSARAIEPVTMKEIADASGIGIATVYRYFPSKLDLVIAIAVRKWGEFLNYVKENDGRLNISDMTAAEQFAHYLDYYVLLYRQYRAILRFNYDFNLFVINAGATAEQLAEYTNTINEFARMFAAVYEKGRLDGTLRTDLPAEALFTASAHIMLAVATRYAAGLVYHAQSDANDSEELEMLRDMLTDRFTVKGQSIINGQAAENPAGDRK